MHRSISSPDRASTVPRVWRSTPRLVDGEISEPASLQSSDFVKIGDVVAGFWATNFKRLRTIAEPAIHEDLQELLAGGSLPEGRLAGCLKPIDAALQRARELSYEAGVLPIRYSKRDDAEESAFSAANEIAVRRLPRNFVYFTARFVVPNPSVVNRKPFVFDQLWISKDEYRPAGVRLIALLLHRGKREPEIERRQDNRFAALGYEVIRASADWLRVDPPGVLHEMLDLAGTPVPDHTRRLRVGKTINDYRCSDCRGPMVRTPEGYGIVHHDEGDFFHETCFSRAFGG